MENFDDDKNSVDTQIIDWIESASDERSIASKIVQGQIVDSSF